MSWVRDRFGENIVVLGEKENVEEEFLDKVNFVEVLFMKMVMEVGS